MGRKFTPQELETAWQEILAKFGLEEYNAIDDDPKSVYSYIGTRPNHARVLISRPFIASMFGSAESGWSHFNIRRRFSNIDPNSTRYLILEQSVFNPKFAQFALGEYDMETSKFVNVTPITIPEADTFEELMLKLAVIGEKQ